MEVDLIEELRNANPAITVAAASQAKDAAAITTPTTQATPRSAFAQTLTPSTLAPPKNIAAAINHLAPAADPDHGAVVASDAVAADLAQDPT